MQAAASASSAPCLSRSVHSLSVRLTLHAFLRPMPIGYSHLTGTRAICFFTPHYPVFLPAEHLVSAYLVLKLGITSPRLLQCIRDPSQTQLCCGISTLGGARRTRMKESHEVQEIRQGTSDDCHLCWRRHRHLVLRAKLLGRLSLRHRDSDCLNHGSGVISGFKIDHNTGNLVPDCRPARQFRRSQPQRAPYCSPGDASCMC